MGILGHFWENDGTCEFNQKTGVFIGFLADLG